MRYHDIITEGRVYQLDWGYPIPVTITTNPSPPQARTLVAIMRKRHDLVYFRGLMVRKTVYVWDGHLMTHDDVRSELLASIQPYSSDLTTFELADYTVTGLAQVRRHAAKIIVLRPGDPDPVTSPFIRTLLSAIDATPER